jgi:hypothetical protein
MIVVHAGMLRLRLPELGGTGQLDPQLTARNKSLTVRVGAS